MIDLSVTCMGYGSALYEGAYVPGIISKIKKRIRQNAWIRHSTDGTLCPECEKKKEQGIPYRPTSF